jgi:adenosylcobinamide kinase/adenosylcobinamide-phosphate guanylyltransferase
LPDRVDLSSATALAAGHPPVTLVLGGVRSGKSRYAETLIEGAAETALYLATAEPKDGEMEERIRIHRERRGTRWRTVEEPIALVDALHREARADRPILVDCLTLWLTNLLLGGRDPERETATLVEALPLREGAVLFVANEVGLGIVPDNALARAFRDHAGRLNQAVAAKADRVVFMAAGLPLFLKGAA